jgi:hypothetical protein
MTIETAEAEITAMKSDIQEIKSDVKKMPDEIVQKVETTMDLKIQLAISETEKKYQGKFIAMLLSIIAEGVGLVISFILKIKG